MEVFFQVLRENKLLFYTSLIIFILFFYFFYRSLPKTPPYLVKSGQVITLKHKNYFASNPIIIQKGGTLIIEKGVSINFGYDSYLNIKGKLIIRGDKKHKVRLYSNVSNRSWRGLKVENGEVDINGCVIKNVYNEVPITFLGCKKVVIKDSFFKYNRGKLANAILVKNSNIEIVNTLFYKNNYIVKKRNKELNSLIVSYDSNVLIKNSRFSNNKGISSGVLALKGGTLELRNDLFKKNYSKTSGGVIFLDSVDKVNIVSCEFKSNTAKVFGGSIYMKDGNSLDISDSVFLNCKSRDGSALYLDGISNFECKNTKFKGNKALFTGAIFLNSFRDKAKIKKASFNSNIATTAACIYINDSLLDISDSTFKLNKSKSGVCFYVKSSICQVKNISGEDNIAIGKGGVFYLFKDSILYLSDSYFFKNKALDSAVLYSKDSKIRILKTKFFKNEAVKDAVGYIYNSDLYIKDCHFEKNYALDKIAVFGMKNSKGQLLNNKIVNNRAKLAYPLFFIDSSSNIKMKDNFIKDNKIY